MIIGGDRAIIHAIAPGNGKQRITAFDTITRWWRLGFRSALFNGGAGTTPPTGDKGKKQKNVNYPSPQNVPSTSAYKTARSAESLAQAFTAPSGVE